MSAVLKFIVNGGAKILLDKYGQDLLGNDSRAVEGQLNALGSELSKIESRVIDAVELIVDKSDYRAKVLNVQAWTKKLYEYNALAATGDKSQLMDLAKTFWREKDQSNGMDMIVDSIHGTIMPESTSQSKGFLANYPKSLHKALAGNEPDKDIEWYVREIENVLGHAAAIQLQGLALQIFMYSYSDLPVSKRADEIEKRKQEMLSRIQTQSGVIHAAMHPTVRKMKPKLGVMIDYSHWWRFVNPDGAVIHSFEDSHNEIKLHQGTPQRRNCWRIAPSHQHSDYTQYYLTNGGTYCKLKASVYNNTHFFKGNIPWCHYSAQNERGPEMGSTNDPYQYKYDSKCSVKIAPLEFEPGFRFKREYDSFGGAAPHWLWDMTFTLSDDGVLQFDPIERPSMYELEGTSIKGDTRDEVYFVMHGKLNWVQSGDAARNVFGDGWSWRVLPQIYMDELLGWQLKDPKSGPWSTREWLGYNGVSNPLVEGEGGRVYLILGTSCHWAANGDSVRMYGFDMSKVKTLGSKPGQSEGDILWSPPKHFEGQRIKGKDSFDIYLVLDGQARHISDKAYASMFNDKPDFKGPIVLPQQKMDHMTKGAALTAAPALIGHGKVFLVDEGKKRWISGPEKFNKYGFDWGRIQHIGEEVNKYPDGPLI